ncbi:FadR/GntR family transcriptional regulator [Puniceibacterium confluentis]|uniref:FadR/GntR family transcriptional regulator n=1 Tax=Puniceibacterium confluentis TaxID=1958944 RepID=UPI0011B60894|nr:FCD domain-containing protein [Puniceibacterium confluentis]
MLQSNKPLKATQSIKRVRSFIVDGGYEAGDRLPAERELTERLSLTRTELRKALDALEREGALWRRVGKGTFVSDGAHGDEPADTIIELGRKLTPFRMMRARLVIEPAIAREAAVNASGEHIRLMQAAMARARAATTWAEYEEQDDLLHHHIARASDNLLLVSLFEQLNLVRRAVSWGTVVRASTRPAPSHTSFAEHDAIATAISERNPEAAYEAMRTHLRSVSDRLFADV